MPALAHVLPIVCPLLFLAGFADSIAGGGGTISVPSALPAPWPARHWAPCWPCT